MIGGYSSPSYSGASIADFLLFLFCIPFGVCDLYYSYRDYSCVWMPIQNSAIKFTLQTWLRIDGGVLLGMAGLICLCGLILCCNPVGCQGFFWFHNVLTWLFALFRIAWLIIASIMFWNYLHRYRLCANPVSRYMWANLIIGYVQSIFYLLIPCLCGLLERPAIGIGANMGVGMAPGMGTGVRIGSGTAFGSTQYNMYPIPVTTPTIRQTYTTRAIY